MSSLRVDWFRVFVDLQRAGVNTRRAARRLGLAPSSIRGYTTHGSEPSHRQGEAIVALWCEVTHRGRDTLPVTRAVPSVAKVLASAR